MQNIDRLFKRVECLMCVSVCYMLFSMCLYDSEASLELVKQKTPRKSFNIWPTSPPPIREALWPGTKKLYRYVAFEAVQQ